MSGWLELYGPGAATSVLLARAARDIAAQKADEAREAAAEAQGAAAETQGAVVAGAGAMLVTHTGAGAVPRPVQAKLREKRSRDDYRRTDGDARLEIQAAVDAAAAEGGGVVELPAGALPLLSMSGSRGIDLKTSTALVGQGWPSVLTRGPGLNGHMFSAIGQRNFRLAHCVADGAGATAGHGLRLQDSSDFMTFGFTSLNSQGYGIGHFHDGTIGPRRGYGFHSFFRIINPAQDGIDSKANEPGTRHEAMTIGPGIVEGASGGAGVDSRMQAIVFGVHVQNLLGTAATPGFRVRRGGHETTWTALHAKGPGRTVVGPSGFTLMGSRVSGVNLVAENFQTGFRFTNADSSDSESSTGGIVPDGGRSGLGNIVALNCDTGVVIGAPDIRLTGGVLDGCRIGMDIIGSDNQVRVVATGNVALSGLAVIGGYQTLAGDLVLLTGQTAPAENGVYTASAGTWTRPASYDSWDELRKKDLRFFRTGAGSSIWSPIMPEGGTLGTDPIAYAQATRRADVAHFVVHGRKESGSVGVLCRLARTRIGPMQISNYVTGIQVTADGIGTVIEAPSTHNVDVPIVALAPVYINWNGDRPRLPVTAPYAATHADTGRLIVATPGSTPLTITLPAAGLTGRPFFVRREGTGTGIVWVSDGTRVLASLLFAGDEVTLRDTGTAFRVEGQSQGSAAVTAAELPPPPFGADGRLQWVVDGAEGAPCLAVAVNGSWRRLTLGAAVTGGVVAEAQALFDAMSTQMTDAQKRIVNTAIARLVGTGVWAKTGGLWVGALHDAVEARRNWRAPATLLTLQSSPGWTALQGWVGNGAGWLDTGGAFSSYGAAQNAASIGAWFNAGGVGAWSGVLGNVGVAGLSLARSGGGVLGSRMNSSTEVSSVTAVGTGEQRIILSRGSPSSYRALINGVVETLASTSAALPAAHLAGLRHGNSFAPAGLTLRAMWAGGLLTTTEEAALDDTMAALLAGMAA